MDRFGRRFGLCRAEKRKALVAFLTAGDPDMDASARDIRLAVENGVDVLELGVPFSDPTADGPTIQEASQRALRAGATLPRVLDLVRRLRSEIEVPIVLFGYANPFFRFGYERLAEEALRAGADGFLVVDLPYEEKAELAPQLDARGLALIPLVAPTTPDARAAEILSGARGFVYCIMVTGVTGDRAAPAAGVRDRVRRLRHSTSLPIAVGFGVSSAEQARRAAAGADAVVVGSALIRAARAGRLAERVRELRGALCGEDPRDGEAP